MVEYLECFYSEMLMDLLTKSVLSPKVFASWKIEMELVFNQERSCDPMQYRRKMA